MSQAQNENSYFDLTATGIGYLNRARKVTPEQGSPYTCVSIAALHGQSDNPVYTYLDCRIVGKDALAFITEHFDAINNRDTKVLVRFKVGDLQAESYEVASGQNKGTLNHLIKSRLLKVTWAKIDNTVVDLGLDDENKESNDQSATTSVAVSDPEQSGNEKGPISDFGEVVHLERDDPNFKQTRMKLKELGYRWVLDEKAWFSPEEFSQLKAAA